MTFRTSLSIAAWSGCLTVTKAEAMTLTASHRRGGGGVADALGDGEMGVSSGAHGGAGF